MLNICVESQLIKSDRSLGGMSNSLFFMKTVKYSKDVDALLIELSDDAIAYAEDEGRVILHYSNNEKLVLIEILDFKQFMSEDIIAELISTS